MVLDSLSLVLPGELLLPWAVLERELPAHEPEGAMERGRAAPRHVFIMGINNNGHPGLLNPADCWNTCSASPGNDCYCREAVKMVNGANK